MPLDDLRIGVTAELADFKAKLATLPDIGAQEARDMVKGIQRQLKEAEKAAAASAKQMKADVGGGLEEMGESAGFLKEKFKETFGVAGELITDFLGPLGGASTGLGGMAGAATAVGVGVAGAAVAVSAYVVGVKALADGALEARDRLIEQGREAELPPGALESLELYEAASHELTDAMDEFRLVVGSALADDLAVLVHTTSEWVQWSSEAANNTSDWVRWLQSMVSLGLSEYLYEWRDGVYEVAAAEALAAEETRKWTAENRQWREESEAMLVALGLIEETTEPVVEAHQAKAAAVDEGAAALADMLATLESVMAREAEYTAAVQEDVEAREAAIEGERQTFLAAWRARQQARDAGVASETERVKALNALGLQLAASSLQSTQSITDSIVASYERRQSEGEKLSEAEKRAAVRAFEIGQAAAVASATLSAAIIGINTVKQLTDVLVPFPIALAAGFAATGTILAGQVAAIESQSPPEFPVGLSPDHRMVGLQPRELVVTERGAADPAVRDTVRRANRGERTSSSSTASSTVDVSVRLDPRLRTIRVDVGRVGKKPPRRR